MSATLAWGMAFSVGKTTALGAAEPLGDEPPQVLSGRLLCGKWRVERLLGTGGMCSVYAAVHRNGKRVAIKALRPELAARARSRQRFLREGYIANRVAHDGAVSVLDDDVSEDGVVFLVMELLEGETLQARAARVGRLSANECGFVADGLLDVLMAAHARGIVHRDVKPSNVLLTLKGQVKLLDFGIASLKEASDALHQTKSGSMLGTPSFMAPEQARGRWSDVDARTDVWAVGATLFSLLTGRLVHEAQTANEALILAATEPARSVGSCGVALPTSLCAVVDRALELEPGQRWQSAAEMRAALQNACAELDPYVWQPAEAALLAAAALGGASTAPESREASDEPGMNSWAQTATTRRVPFWVRPWSRSRLVLVGGSLLTLAGASVLLQRFWPDPTAAIPNVSTVDPNAPPNSDVVRAPGTEATTTEENAEPQPAPAQPDTRASSNTSAEQSPGTAPPPAPRALATRARAVLGSRQDPAPASPEKPPREPDVALDPAVPEPQKEPQNKPATASSGSAEELLDIRR